MVEPASMLRQPAIRHYVIDGPDLNRHGESTMDHTLIRTTDEREMRRLVRRGALIMAEYNWSGSGVPELEERGREWVLQILDAKALQRAA